MPGELVDHFGAQLREAGWTPDERTSAEGVAVETFRVTDSGGVAWHGVLVASLPSADADRVIALRVTRVEGMR
jgi:hypothetical protein